MEEINITDIVQNQKVTPEIENIASGIRVKNPINAKDKPKDLGYDFGQNVFSGTGMQEKQVKPSLSFENTNVTDAFANVGGEWLAKYPTYKRGRDNAEYAAQNQTSGEKWANGLLKFGGKTLNAVTGGTYGVVNGVGAMISDGNVSSLYDNDFSNWLSDLDTKMNYQLPNYYTKQEEQKGVFSQMGTTNFWADKFLGGLSFTAGALVSEGLWAYATGGTSLATIGARNASKLSRLGRWGVDSLGEAKVLDGVGKMKSFLKSSPGQMYKTGTISKDLAIGVGKAGEIASLVAFTGRSAGFEASQEALQYKKEAEENFYNSFTDRDPTAEEIRVFEKNLEHSSNAVFTANLAIVGASTLVTMGNILDIKNPIKTGLSEFIDRKAFGYGFDKVAGETLKVTTKQKVARNTFDYFIKPSVTEGLFEEGLQGVTNKFGNKWIEHSYNPKHTTESFNNIKAMGESLSEQYGTDEGWKENMLGILIGVAGGSINARSEQKQKEQELNYKEATNKVFNTNTLQSLMMPSRIQSANRIAGFAESAKENEQKGNISKALLDKQSGILTFVNARQVQGESISDTTLEMKNALDTITVDQWKESGIEPEKIQQEKEDRLNEFTTLAKQWKTNKTYWKYMIGKKLAGEQTLNTTALENATGSQFSKNAQIVEALAWQSTIGENANVLMRDIKDIIAKEVGTELSNALNLKAKLSSQTLRLKEQILAEQIQYAFKEKMREELTQKIAEAVDVKKDKEGYSPRVEMSAQLLAIEAEITALQEKADITAREINVTSNYEKGLSDVDFSVDVVGSEISGSDLLSVSKNIKSFQDAISGYDIANPQKAQYLKDLLDEYNQSEQIFLESQATQRVLASKDFKMENIGSWLGGKLGKKDMNENTKEWLQNALNTYAEYKTREIATTVTEEPVAEQEDLTKSKPKAEEVKTETKSEAEQYKERIENVLKNYDMLYMGDNYDGIANKQPTQEEIEAYKNGTASADVVQKLQDWKLLDSAVDSENTSVAEMVQLIQQLEQQQDQIETKDEVTEEEAYTQLKDEMYATGESERPDLLVNVTAPVTVKLTKDGNYQLTHLKPRTIVERIGTEYTIEGKGKDIDNLKVGDVVKIDGTSFSFITKGRIEIKKEDFDSREPQLNMFIRATDTVNWTFVDVYTRLGQDEVKMPSDFKEAIKAEESYNIKKGDRLTLHIKDVDGWNKTKIGGTKEQIKIFLRDANGNDIQTLKAERETTESVVPQFMSIRQEAFDRWEKAGKPETLDLGISVEVDNVFLGSAELAFSDGQLTDLPISKEAVEKVIIAKGYILNGEITLDNEIADVDKTFVGAISKKNPDLKQPIVVFRKGKYQIAFPISLVKTNTPVAFDALLVGSPQEIVLNINNAIIEKGIKAEKLTYKDIQIFNGEVELSEKAELVREAFANKKTFVPADTLASKKYKKENLTNDATIKIQLDDLDRAISAPKVRIKLDDTVKFETKAEVKVNNIIDVQNRLNDLAIDIYEDFIKNADKKYIDAKGDIIEDTKFTDTFDENTIERTDVYIKKVANVKVLKQAFSDKISKRLETAIGAEKVIEVKKLLAQYENIQKQIVVKDNDGAKNICN